jgi:hypothetical protein
MKRVKPPGDPLVTVMQLEELNKKLDQIIDRLERMEQRARTQSERSEEASEKIPPAPVAASEPPLSV